MKTITQDFEQALKGIKQIDVIISYADRENTNFIVTQNSEFLITQAQDFLVTESSEVVIDNGGIQNCSIYWNTDLLKSCCKMLDLETSNSISKGTELFVKIGLLVDDEYEYVDYGSFITTQDSEKKLDEGTYLTTAYDKIIQFSINASENPLTFETGVTYTLKEYLEMICSKCGVPYSLGGLSFNLNAGIRFIDSDPYAGNKNVTYRDIVDDIAECLGTNFIINTDGKLTFKDLDSTSVMTIDEQNLKDTNVNIGEKKNGIDGVQVYDGTTMLNYAGDDNSVFKIKNNNIMNKASSQLLSNVLTRIEGFSYYAFDINTFGVLALEPFDCFTTSANNTNYLLCALHNEISVNQGLGEQISYEFKEEDATYEYSVTSDEDKQRNAYIEIDKANSQVVLKANANGNIVQAELTADPSTGSSFNVKADNVNFEGKTFNLTSENVAITSNNFNVDNSGNMTCNNANITGGNLEITSTEANPKVKVTSSNAITQIFGDGYNIKKNNVGAVRFGASTNSTYGVYGRIMLDGESNNRLSMSTRGLWYYDENDTNVITIQGTNGWIYCVGVSQSSKEESKKDFEKVGKALDIIKDIDIYKYHYKNENKDSKKHYGFVIGKNYKYSKDITSLDDEGNEVGVDLYSFVSVCCKAIQEQQEQIEELKKEIKSLKGDDN